MFLSSDPAIPQPASNHSPYQDRTEDESEVEQARNQGLERLSIYSREAAMPSHWLEEHPPSPSNEVPHQYHDNSQPPLSDKQWDTQHGVQTTPHSRWAEEQDMSSHRVWESRPISRSPSDDSPASIGYRPTMPHHPPSNSEYMITSPIYYPPDAPTRASSSYFNESQRQPEPSSYHPSVSALLKELKPDHADEFPAASQHSDVFNSSSVYCTYNHNHNTSRSSERTATYQTTSYDHAGFGGISPSKRSYDDRRTSKDTHLPLSSNSDIALQQTSAVLYTAECNHHESQAKSDRQTRPSDLDSLFDGSSGVEDVINVSEQPTTGTDDPIPVPKNFSASGLSRNFEPPKPEPSLEKQGGPGLGLDSQRKEDLNLIPGLSGIAAVDDGPASVVSHGLVNDTFTDSRPLSNAADRFKNILAANGIKCDPVPENLAKVLESSAAKKVTKGTQPDCHQASKDTIEHRMTPKCSCRDAGQDCLCAPSSCTCLGCDCTQKPDNSACCTNKGTAPSTKFEPQSIERSTSRDDIFASTDKENATLHQESVRSSVAQVGQSRGDINATSGNQNSCLTPSRPDTPRPLPDQSRWRYGTELMNDHVRQSVEPEIPVTNWIRESTPAYEDRSNTPSPCSRSDRDVEMQNAPNYQMPSPAPEAMHSPSLERHEPNTIRPDSPKKLAAPPIPADIPTLKQPKRGDRRKSGVQGGKVEKRSVTGSKAKGVPKSRNATRKPTTSMGKLIDQANKASSASDQQEVSNTKSVGNVAAAVQKIEQELQKQKDGNPVRRSQRANKGVRPLS